MNMFSVLKNFCLKLFCGTGSMALSGGLKASFSGSVLFHTGASEGASLCCALAIFSRRHSLDCRIQLVPGWVQLRKVLAWDFPPK